MLVNKVQFLFVIGLTTLGFGQDQETQPGNRISDEKLKAAQEDSLATSKPILVYFYDNY